MKFIDLINRFFEDYIFCDLVWTELYSMHENWTREKVRKAYICAIGNLISLEPAELGENPMRIIINTVHVSDYNTEEYINVFGMDDSLHKDDGNTPSGLIGQEVSWALDFMPWTELLNCEVEIQESEISEYEALANILWEITFHGYTDKEVQESAAKILGDVKESIEEYNLQKEEKEQKGEKE